jgi:cytoskeletal protein CcmA (bactofilin family)
MTAQADFAVSRSTIAAGEEPLHGSEPSSVPVALARPMLVPVSTPAPASEPTAEAAPAPAPTSTNLVEIGLDPLAALVVPAGVTIRGQVVATQLYLAGSIDGEVVIKGGPAVIAQDAVLKGSLDSVGDVTVAGEVEGDGVVLRVKGRLDVGETASVRGDVQYDRIVIREGAKFDGRISRYED